MDEFTVSEGRNMKEEDQNKKLEFVKKVKETKFNQELFFKQMKLFSQFVTYTNPDYMYNETYLLRFCQQYAKFQSYICKKYDIYWNLKKEIYKYRYDKWENIDLVLILDQTCINSAEEYHIAEKIRVDLVCSDKIQVKVIVSCDSKEYLFFKSYEMKKIQEICLKDIREWMEDMLDGEEYRKHNSL